MFLHKIYDQQVSLLPYLNTYNNELADRDRPYYSLANKLKSNFTFCIIAEFKRRSPSNPIIHPHANLKKIISIYEETTADAYSILTESRYFGGLYDDLKMATTITDKPVLNKDFFIDKVQIDIAHKLGADVILLIAALGDKIDLKDLSNYAKEKGLEVLMEVHDQRCLDRIKAVPYDILGINNRDLHSLKTNINHTKELIDQLPDTSVPIITESGIFTVHDVESLKSTGITGALIGTAIMNAANKNEFIKQLKEDR